jgi:hypothetical protein
MLDATKIFLTLATVAALLTLTTVAALTITKSQYVRLHCLPKKTTASQSALICRAVDITQAV